MPKYAIVTGAASGLGRAISLRLARDGWMIALADINTAGAEETRRLVIEAGGEARVERLDITQLNEWQALSARLQADWPRLDLLVSNAGIGGSGLVGEFSLEQWERMLQVNLWGGILGCHVLLEWMKRNAAGAHLIGTASFAAMACAPSMAAYNVSKAGTLALFETLYGELKPLGIGVTVICPLFFRTNLLKDWPAGSAAELSAAEFYTDSARFTADDVADAAVRAMHCKRLYVILGVKARWYWRLKRLLPQTFLNLIVSKYQAWVRKHPTATNNA